MKQSRRRFLQTAATTAALAATSGNLASAQNSSDLLSSVPVQPVEMPVGSLPFLHGVASGDPIPDSVILWTRITPSWEAVPGSGHGEDITVQWEIATDEGFTRISATNTTVTTAGQDHTVHVDPHGLQPDTVYFFRFTVLTGDLAGSVSPVGRTRTAPAFTSSPENLRFAVASCANWESGFFSAYADIARRGRTGELDFTLFLGDYIYEYAPEEYSGAGPYRLLEPAHETVSLKDYRIRYGQYRTDPQLQDAHAALPWITVWDDHEIANNSWRAGAENHDPGPQGDWTARRDAAMQAYFEWLPVRATAPSAGGHIYRSFSFGDLAELVVMDLRTYRDREAGRVDLQGFNDPHRTMVGSEQFEWLRSAINTSDAAWTVLGNSVMLSPMNLVTLNQDQQLAEVSSFLGEHRVGGVPLNSDQWDGYAAERARLLDVLASHHSKVLVCTGDIHSEWGHVVSHRGQELGAEVVCSSISAPNVNEILNLPPGNALSLLAQRYLRQANPHLRHVELDSHGYALVNLGPHGVEMTWQRVDITQHSSAASVGQSWSWP